VDQSGIKWVIGVRMFGIVITGVFVLLGLVALSVLYGRRLGL